MIRQTNIRFNHKSEIIWQFAACDSLNRQDITKTCRLLNMRMPEPTIQEDISECIHVVTMIPPDLIYETEKYGIIRSLRNQAIDTLVDECRTFNFQAVV